MGQSRFWTDVIIGVAILLIVGFAAKFLPFVWAMLDHTGARAQLNAKFVGIGIAALVVCASTASAILNNQTDDKAGTIKILSAVFGAGLMILFEAQGETGVDLSYIRTALYLVAVGVLLFVAPLLFPALRSSRAITAYYAWIGIVAVAGMVVGGLVQLAAHAVLWPDGVGQSAFVFGPFATIAAASVWSVAISYWFLAGGDVLSSGQHRIWVIGGTLTAAILCFGYGAWIYGQRDWMTTAGLDTGDAALWSLVVVGGILACALAGAAMAAGAPLKTLGPITFVVAVTAAFGIVWAGSIIAPAHDLLRGTTQAETVELAKAWWLTQATSLVGAPVAVWVGVVLARRWVPDLPD